MLQIFTVNYNIHGEHHRGAKDFVFWHLAQIQYNNPKIQVCVCVCGLDLVLYILIYSLIFTV